MLVRKAPDAAQKAVRAFNTGVVPLQRGFGRGGEHGVQARGVSAVFLDQVLRVDTVVLALAHGAYALVGDQRAGRQVALGLFELGAQHLAGLVMKVLDLVRPEILDAAFVGLAGVDVVEHHALRQQLGERLVDLHQTKVTHDLGPETRVEQMKNRMLDTAYVLVHAATAGGFGLVPHPVVGTGTHHLLAVLRVAIAHEVPGRINERVHGVGLTPGGLAANRADHAGMKAFVLDQRIARAVRHAVLRQDHGQVFFRHRHGAVFAAMNDRDRRAPVALTAHTPVTQTPGGFLLAQAFGGQVSSHGVQTGFEGQAVVLARLDRNARAFFGVPVLPLLVVEEAQGRGGGRVGGRC